MIFMLMAGALYAAETLYYDQAPVDDAYVDQYQPTLNTGSYTYLSTNWISSAFGASKDVTLLKFDISEIPDDATILSANAGVFFSQAGIIACDYDLFYLGFDAWEEETVNWNAVQSYIDTSADNSFGMGGTQNASTYKDWDLFGSYRQWTEIAGDLEDNYVCFAIVSERSSFVDNSVYFNSQENEINPPYLKIAYTVTPVPAPGAFSLVLMGVGSILLKRKK